MNTEISEEQMVGLGFAAAWAEKVWIKSLLNDIDDINIAADYRSKLRFLKKAAELLHDYVCHELTPEELEGIDRDTTDFTSMVSGISEAPFGGSDPDLDFIPRYGEQEGEWES